MPKTKTISELQKELAAKQSQVKQLQSSRSVLETQLAVIDRQIAALMGAGRAARATKKKKAAKKKVSKRKVAKKKAKRAQNKQSLADVLLQVLKGKNGVKVADATKLVLAEGYKSASKQFQTIVNQTLLRDKRFRKAGRGVYKLKG